jgi:glycosyltransferase involved in cell wall biosynthesis
MKIGITTFGCDGGKSGISQYLIRLLHEFPGLAAGDEFELLTLAEDAPVFLPEGSPIVPVVPSGVTASPVRSILWHLLNLPRVARQRGYDVLFLPAGNRRLPRRMPCPTVGTIHDFSWLHMAGKYDMFRTFYLTRILPRLMGRLTLALTVSESSRGDILANTSLPPERVLVTHLAADPDTYQPRDREAARARLAARYGIAKPYVLYISRLEHPGKNHVALIQAFQILKAAGLEHQLVLPGGDFLGAEMVHQAAAASPCHDDIILTGFADFADLPYLYNGADLFVFPSLYEGFGLPLLEAMASGTAVAAANRSSLPEVGGQAAVYFDPHQAEDMAEAIGGLLRDPDRRRSYEQAGLARAAEFSWRRTAEQTLDAIRQAACTKV